MVIGEGRTDWLRPLVVAMAVAVLFKLSVEVAKYACLRRLRITVAATMSKQFLPSISFKLPLTFYTQRYSGGNSNAPEIERQHGQYLVGKARRHGNQCSDDVLLRPADVLLQRHTHTGRHWVLPPFPFTALRILGKRRVNANTRLRQDYGKVPGDTIAALQSMETIRHPARNRLFHEVGRALRQGTVTPCRTWK